MKTIKEIIENYSDYEIPIDDRFGVRLCDFLKVQEAEEIGYSFKEEYKDTHVPKEWTEENIIEQLKRDVEFGWEKCCYERGISASLMAEVVQKWCNVLENGLYDIPYGYYGDNVFKTVAKHYGFKLEEY